MDITLSIKTIIVIILIAIAVWPIRGILNKEIRYWGPGYRIKVKGTGAIILSVLFLILILIAIFITAII